MRVGAALLLAVSAFVAGLLAERLAAPASQQVRRAPPREAAAGGAGPGLPVREAEPAVESGPAARDADEVAEAPPQEDSPAEDQPLLPRADLAEWNGSEFARWYAIHKKAWRLPDVEERDLVRYGEHLLWLGRIPRRDLLLRLLDAFRDRDAEEERAGLENEGWAEAHAGAPEDDPGWAACRNRIREVYQRFFDALHEELAYADYLSLTSSFAGNMSDPEPELRPPSSAADAYAHSAAIARDQDRFERWYRAYARLLGFPERDEDFLIAFRRYLVVPLGRLPEPELMRTLQQAYAPFHSQLKGGADFAEAARKLFAALDRNLTLLDYERLRHSREWDSRLGIIPPPTDR